jgi:hypothetical protein
MILCNAIQLPPTIQGEITYAPPTLLKPVENGGGGGLDNGRVGGLVQGGGRVTRKLLSRLIYKAEQSCPLRSTFKKTLTEILLL